MSVTGVVIVIALILALQIDKVRALGSPEEPLGLSTDDSSALASPEELQELELELADIKGKVEQLLVLNRNEESKKEIEADITQLESRITRQINLRNSKKQNGQKDAVASPEYQQEVAKVEALKIAIEDCIKQLKQLMPQNKELGKSLRNIEIKLKEAESAVIKAKAKERDLVLIPERNNTTKEPIIVDVSANGLVILRLDTGNSRKMVSADNFSKYCSRLKTTDHYFVFFFRPSGISRFEELRKIARREGFEVGYDAIEERTKLKLGAK